MECDAFDHAGKPFESGLRRNDVSRWGGGHICAFALEAARSGHCIELKSLRLFFRLLFTSLQFLGAGALSSKLSKKWEYSVSEGERRRKENGM